MAEAFIGVLLENLNSLIQNELGLLKGYKKEMKKLSSTLSTIQAVLEDAEEKQLKDKAIQNWLRDLKDAAYELDDILDVCQTEASKKVHASYFAKFSANVLFRRKIGIRMRDAREKLDTISGDRMNFHLKSETVGDRRAEVMARRETGSDVTQTEVYGREEDKEKIVESLVKDVAGSDDISIYPILGMGGLGKTTLAQLVFNDDRVERHFECTIWVCVFEDFNVKRLITEMITSLGGQVNESSNLADLQRRLRDMLNGKRYLLVLDDVWNEDEEKWDQLKCTLTCGSKGSSIVVTTRLAKVASIVGTLPPHHLSCVSEHDCWLLFKQRAFGNNTEPPMNILAIAKEIVKKCQGVPLAAKTLGSLMHFKSNENKWLDVKDSELWNLPQEENSILPALRLSYSNLPVKLRQCFAFCAVFPKNLPIQKRNLIHLWMANGFISSNGTLDAEDVGNEVFNELYWRSLIQDFSVDDSRNSNRWYKMHDAEDVGKEVFNELYWRSLIQDYYVDDRRRYKMHDLVHDLAQYVAGDECCSTEAERASNLLSRRTHHVALTFPKETFTIPDALNSVQSLRTLCINSAYSLSDMCFADIPKLPSLRALEIQNAMLMELSHSIGNSMHLRYLNLSGTKIRFLPKSLCSLWNLQILNLERCLALQQFPHDMRRLKNLQYLFIDGCSSLTSMPPKLRQMSALRILPLFIVGRRRGYRLSELAGLNLSGRLHIKHLERVGNHMDAAEARLGEKQNLRELILSWECDGPSGLQGNAEKVLHALEPHSNLVELTIWGYRGNSMPLWMSSPVLNNVVSISLLNLNFLQLPPLGGKLPSLKYLRIHGMEHVKYINNYCCGEEVKVFPSLEKLDIHKLLNLEKLSIEQGRNTFPCLNIMCISGCPKLTLPCLPSLTELRVESCCSEVLLSSISNLNKLTSLWIDDNDEVMTLPDSVFMNLTSLQSLTIVYFTKLESLPEQGMRCLKSLQSLSINYCDRLNCLSDGLKHLTALKRLEICECPELQKRYQKEIGEDWHKIKHIPFVDVW